jgi:glycosyltransferase involved in cell wall biosynthesis
MTNVTPGLSFVVPCYNEERGVAATLERLKAVLAKLDLPTEIIAVNDGSRDGTRAQAETVSGVRVVNHPVNTGYGSAIKTGILCARHEWVGIVDADGTYDIELIPELVSRMRSGFDMAVAARTNTGDHDGPAKKFFRKALIVFLQLIINRHIVDPNSGLRIFKRALALTFYPFLCETFSFTTSITIFALGMGYFVSYVPMQYAEREGKTKVRHFRDSLRMMQLILQGITFFNPIKFSILLILGLLVLGGLPTFLLAGLGFPTLAWQYMALAVTASLLLAIGILGDIIRISFTSMVNPKSDLVSPHSPLTHGLPETDEPAANP